jgi:hypothetical protein
MMAGSAGVYALSLGGTRDERLESDPRRQHTGRHVAHAISEAATDCLAVLRAQLQDNPELTPNLRLRMEAYAAPIILARTTEAIEAGWTALQVQAGRAS